MIGAHGVAKRDSNRMAGKSLHRLKNDFFWLKRDLLMSASCSKPRRGWLASAAAVLTSTLISVAWIAADEPAESGTAPPPTKANGFDAKNEEEKEKDPVKSAPPPFVGPANQTPLALVGGTLVTLDDDDRVISNGVVVIVNGHIAQVGPTDQVTIPEEAERLDLTGFLVTPGLIDARSVAGLTSDAAADSASDASLDPARVLDPFAEEMLDLSAQGITAVSVQPSPAGQLGGRSILVRVGPNPDPRPEAMVLHNEAGVQAALGAGGGPSNGLTRPAEFDRLKKGLADAKAYQEKFQKYQDALKKYEADLKAYNEAKKQAQAVNAQDASKSSGQSSNKGDAENKEAAKTPGEPLAKKDKAETNDRPAPSPTPEPDRPPTRDELRRIFEILRERGIGRPTPEILRDILREIRDESSSESQKKQEPEPQDQSPKKEEAETKKASEKKEQEDARKNVPSPPTKPTPPDREEPKELLVRVLENVIPLRLELHRADDLERAFKWLDELKIPVILEGLSHPGDKANLVRTRRVPLVLGPWVELEGAPPSYRAGRPSDWPAGLIDEESRFALASFTRRPAGSRWLRVQAAAAVASGIAPPRVLRAITRWPAEFLGRGDTLGRIQTGYRADLAVFAGDPLDPSAPVRLTLSGGVATFQNAQVKPSSGVGPVTIASLPPTAGDLSSADRPAIFPQVQAPAVVFTTTRLMTEGGGFTPGAVWVEAGAIKAFGPDAAANVPANVPVVELGDRPLTPGLVAGPSDFGRSAAIDDPAEPIAALTAADALDPFDPALRRRVEAGFLTVALAPGSSNVVAGAVAAVRPAAKTPLVNPAIAEKLVLSEASRSLERSPATLSSQLALLNRGLEGTLPPTNFYLPEPLKTRFEARRLESLQAVKKGERPALIEARRAEEVAQVLELVARHKLAPPTLIGPVELTPFLDDLKAAGARVVVSTTALLRDERGRLTREVVATGIAGIPLALADDGEPGQARIAATQLVNAGLPPEVALLALTHHAAEAVALPPSCGRLAVGAAADLVIWTGHPLDLRTNVEALVIEGRLWRPPSTKSDRSTQRERIPPS